MKRTFLTSAATVLAIGAQARAADLPVPTLPPTAPPIYNWTGVYVGVNGGWADGISNWTNNCPGCQSLTTPTSGASPPGLPGGETGSFSVSGYLAGGTLGANYQIGAWVYGVEGDFDWTHLTGSSGSTCGGLSIAQPPPTGCETESDWLATLRGRVGYAFPGLAGDNVLIYGTAGGAFARIKTGLIPPSTFDSSTVAGWAVGAGVEVAFAPNWTAKVEYLFVDLPNVTCTTTTNCGVLAGSTVTLNENMVRAGINYKFGAW
jgi:outer membrane immunogenic protein